MNLATPKAGAQHELLFTKPTSGEQERQRGTNLKPLIAVIITETAWIEKARVFPYRKYLQQIISWASETKAYISGSVIGAPLCG